MVKKANNAIGIKFRLINALSRIKEYVACLWPSSNPYMLGIVLLKPTFIFFKTGVICILLFIIENIIKKNLTVVQ